MLKDCLEHHQKARALLRHKIINRNDVYLNGHQPRPLPLLDHYPQKPIRLGTVNKGGQGERIYSPLGHSITLSAYGGGVGAKTGLYLIGKNIRRLTPRECARVSGFPEDFVLSSNSNVSYKQFGNTVVVNVVSAVYKSILEHLEGQQANIRLAAGCSTL